MKLWCEACDLTVSGRFGANEFAGLAEEDLHFLRIFVLCEGRIREMESAMGVSYPTIKARMARLKETLAGARVTEEVPAAREAGRAGGESATAGVLKDLEAGRMTYEQAMERLRKNKKEQL